MNILDIAIAKKLAGGGGGSGTDNYNDLSNLPKINDTTLSGNKSSSALGLQSEINSDSKLASDLVDDTNQDNKFVTSTEKNTWNAKQNAIDADHKLSSDLVDDANKTNKFVTSTEKNTWNAKQNAIDSDHKLSSDLVDDTNKTNKFVTSTEKNTWNAKQNAIDSDHKLSSSLVSFSTAEAAALASGIDSTKVGQISTNQTNILYGLQTGVKNIIQLDPGTYTNNVATFTVNNDGEVIVNSGSAGTSAITIGEFELPAGDYVYWYDNTASNGKCDVRLMNGATRLALGSFTLSSTATIHADVYSYAVNSNTSIKPMLCTANAWAQEPNVYRKPALPNYDLTRLEAEDRASLAEVVDSGAKNLWDFPNASEVSRNSLTITNNNDGSKTFTSENGNWQRAVYKVNVPSSGLYYLTAKVKNASLPTNRCYIFACPTASSSSNYYEMWQITGNGETHFSFNVTGDLYIWVYLNYSDSTGNNTLTLYDVMICTKAAFGVSNKFVPYRPSYDDLIAQSTYTTSTSSTSITNLLYNAANTLGISPTNINFFVVSVYSDASDCLVICGAYKHGTIGYGVSMASRNITFEGAVNNLGTVGWTGGTAPYHVQVRFF